MSLVEAVRRPLLSSVVATLRGVVSDHAVLMTAIAIHAAAAYAFVGQFGLTSTLMMHLLERMMTFLIPGYLIIGSLVMLAHMAIVDRPDRPIEAYLARVLPIVGDPRRLVGTALVLTLMTVFMTNFGTVKTAVPIGETAIVWDRVFADLDAALHFGVDPWRLLSPILEVPRLVWAISLNYHVWVLVLSMTLVHAAFSPHSASRQGYLLGSVLAWGIGGNLLAVLFASGGPVYYEPLGYGDRFAPLMERLHAISEVIPVHSLDIQKMVWDGHVGLATEIGMSAMPSMHLASTTLITLYLTTLWRPARWVAWPFLGLILIGSVLLGWHYAADSYLGILIGWVSWRIGRRVTSFG